MPTDAALLNKGVDAVSEKGLSGGATAGIVIGILLLVLVCVVGGYFGWQHRDEVKERIPFLKSKEDDYNDNYGEDVMDTHAKEESLALGDDDSKEYMDDMTDDDADVTDDEGAKLSQSSSRGQTTPPPSAAVPAKVWGGLALFSLFRGKKSKEDDAKDKLEKDIENPDPFDKSSRSELDDEESSRSLFFGDPDKGEKAELHTDIESDNDFSFYDESPVAKARQAVVKEPSYHEESGSESDYESDGYDDDKGKTPPANFKEVRSSSSTAQTKNKASGKQSQSDDDSYSGDSGSYSSRSHSSSSYYSEDESGSDYSSESDTDRKKGRQGRR
jgi:hypothetical protein